MTKVRLGARPLFLAAAYMATAPFCTLAQTAATNDKPIAFEVVSIRPDPSSTFVHDQIAVTPDGWRMAHGSLMAALLTAYVPTTSDAMMYSLSTLVGIPDWMRTEMYNIDAKVPESDLAAWQNPATQPAMLRTMMQAMLADRCKLAVHRGSREVAVYSLVIGKSGPRLKASVIALHVSSEVFMHGSKAPKDTQTFVQVFGTSSTGIVLLGNDLSHAAQPVVLKDGAVAASVSSRS
jgi:uncharacterized protein (TIGR03435 family)